MLPVLSTERITHLGRQEAAALRHFNPAHVSSWVKMRKFNSEHFSTAVPQKADVVLNAANGSFVPTAVFAAVRRTEFMERERRALTPA